VLNSPGPGSSASGPSLSTLRPAALPQPSGEGALRPETLTGRLITSSLPPHLETRHVLSWLAVERAYGYTSNIAERGDTGGRCHEEQDSRASTFGVNGHI